MTIAAHTGRAEVRPCDRCGAAVEHRESAPASGPTIWMAERHEAPCGLPCMGGGVHPRHVRPGGAGAHGYHDRCPRCGPLRVLPEVVVEMRTRAGGLREPLSALIAHRLPAGGQCHCDTCRVHSTVLAESTPAMVTDLLRALDEIATLRRELDAARQSRDDARERATFAELELQDQKIATEERRAAESPPVEWELLAEVQRATAAAWVREQAATMRFFAKGLRGRDDLSDEALRLEALAASLLALVALPEAPSPLTPEQRDALGREVGARIAEAQRGGRGISDADLNAIAEHFFLRGLGAGHDLLAAGQLLRRLLGCDEIPAAARTIPPGLALPIQRILGAVERLGDVPADREPPCAEPLDG